MKYINNTIVHECIQSSNRQPPYTCMNSWKHQPLDIVQYFQMGFSSNTNDYKRYVITYQIKHIDILNFT